ncbi:MAG: hypothetical protein HY719_15380, partial [Planctomycetes bacterium]|nr:hypothetical protein [Planctomycetota bacterium]
EADLKALSAVARMRGRFGAGMVVKVLRGSRAKALTRFGLSRLPTYGLLAGESEAAVAARLDDLLKRGLVATSGGMRPTVGLTAAGAAFLRARGRQGAAETRERREAGERADGGRERPPKGENGEEALRAVAQLLALEEERAALARKSGEIARRVAAAFGMGDTVAAAEVLSRLPGEVLRAAAGSRAPAAAGATRAPEGAGNGEHGR